VVLLGNDERILWNMTDRQEAEGRQYGMKINVERLR
jgi:hypothetical protein